MIPFRILYYKKNSIVHNTAKIYPFSMIINSVIECYSYISYSCTINNCTIGKFCSIAKGVKVGLGKHPINFISSSPIFYSPKNPLRKILSNVMKFEENQSVKIGNDVWIGANAVILDGITIGNGAIIGANSVVIKDVEPYSIMGGVPAKLIKKRFIEKEIEILQNSNWWDLPISFFEKDEVINTFSKEFDEQSINTFIKLIQSEKQKNR